MTGEATDAPQSHSALTPQELRLVDCAARGAWWKPEAADGGAPDMDPANAAGWEPNRALRAIVLRHLLTGEAWPGEGRPWPVASKGLMVDGAILLGALDLEGATLERTLWLQRCLVVERVLLRDARTRMISFRGSHLKGALGASRAVIDGSLFLDEGFRADGETDLTGAHIKGQLGCIAGHFENASGPAINANTLNVDESVQLRDGFTARGEINLVRARIGGNLRCEHATFSNLAGDAIDLTLAGIGAGFFLHNLRAPEGAGRGLEGRLVLDQARCRTYCDDRRAWPEAGRLVLDGFVYERFHASDTRWRTRRAWLQLQARDHLDGSFRPQPWTQTINVLRAMGHERDAKELSVQRELARARSRSTNRPEKFWLLALNIFVGNGYKPWRAAGWSAAFILFGWIVFASAGAAGYMAPRDGNVRLSDAWNVAPPATPRLPRTYPPFNALVFALDAYLPVVAFEEDDAWEPSTQQTIPTIQAWPDRALLHVLPDLPAGFFAGGWHRAVYWLEEILGWVFVSLFIAGMSGIMKRE